MGASASASERVTPPSTPDSDSTMSESHTLSESPRVCIVCHSYLISPPSMHEYKIYMMDLDDLVSWGCEKRHPPTIIDPTIRLKGCFSALAFRTLGSTLYVFYGYSELVPKAERTTAAAKFELSEEILAGDNFTLEKGRLDCISEMHHVKIHPKAFSTLDGKGILVCSSLIYSGFGDIAFELYHVSLDSWEELPGLPSRDTFVPQTHGFLRDSEFLVQIKEGMFLLDLRAPVKSWRKLYGFGGGPRMPFSGGFVAVKDGEFCFTPHFAYDTRKTMDGFTSGRRLPCSSFGKISDNDCYRHTYLPRITLLEEGDGYCDTGVLQAQMFTWKYLRLVMDVGRTDVDKNSPTLLNARVLKSLVFLIEADQDIYDLNMLDVFTM